MMDPQQFNRGQVVPATGFGPNRLHPVPLFTELPRLTLNQPPRYALAQQIADEHPLKPPAPPADQIVPEPEKPSGALGITISVAGAAAAIVGPKKFWIGGKWVFRNILVGGTVVEAATWWIAFQAPTTVSFTSHHLTSFFLGWPSNVPIYSREFTFLERHLHGIPNIAGQRELALRYSEFSVTQLRQRIEELRPGRLSNIALLEERLLLERILSIKLDIQVNQNKIADRVLRLLNLLRGVGVLGPAQSDDVPATPAGSTDP